MDFATIHVSRRKFFFFIFYFFNVVLGVALREFTKITKAHLEGSHVVFGTNPAEA